MSKPATSQPPHEYQRFLHSLPQDWECKEIKQLGKVVGGGTPSRDVPTFWRGAIPWVTPGEVSGNATKLLYNSKEHISASGLAGSGAKLLPAGSLMVTTRATLGARVINAVPMATNQGFKSIVFKQPADSSFYLHLFEKVQSELVRRASGTTFLEISGSEFAGIRVPSPCPNEKRLISDVIDSLDTAIHETEAIIAKLKVVKQGLLHDLLTRGIDANGELRQPQSEAPHLYKQSLLGWIPREWDTFSLAECSRIAGGVTLGRAVSGNGLVEMPYLRVANVQDGYVDLRDIKTVQILRSEIDRFALADGDVLMNEGGDFDKLGRGTVWRAQITPCLHQNHVFRVRCDAMKLIPDYLEAYSASPRGKRFFVQSSKQSTNLASINSTQLKAFPLALPDVREQRLIVERLEAVSDRVSAEELELHKLGAFKAGLMDDLLTGRVRVTPLLAEVEEERT